MRGIFTATICLLAWSFTASAYIPDYQMILSRTAENHGRGGYVIEQDVVFRGEPDPLVVREVWTVTGDNALRVDFSGRGSLKGLVQGAIIYDQNQKQWRDDAGKLLTSRLSDDFAEGFFHFRISKSFKPKLVALKIAPSESLRERNPIAGGPEKLDFSYPAQDFVRLSRSGGTVNYAIGTPSPADGSPLPGLWIEQDQFVVRKVRFPSTSTVTAGEYVRNSGGMWLPQERTYSWGTSSAQVHVASVKPISGKPSPEIFKATSLDPQKNPNVSVKLPNQDILREFYQRFR